MLWLNLTTLWAWDNPQTKWYFYLPQLDVKRMHSIDRILLARAIEAVVDKETKIL